MVAQLVSLLTHWDDEEILTKTAMTISALAKSENGRNACSNPILISPLLQLLSNLNNDLKVLIQVCRALGNICYENSKCINFLLKHLYCSS